MSQTILLLVKDVFFSVKLTNDLRTLGHTPLAVRDTADFLAKLRAEPRPALVLLDLMIRGFDWQAALAQAREAGLLDHLPILAFGPHTDTALRQRARAAGVTRIVANSKALLNLPEVISRYLAMPDDTDEADAEAAEL